MPAGAGNAVAGKGAEEGVLRLLEGVDLAARVCAVSPSPPVLSSDLHQLQCLEIRGYLLQSRKFKEA